MNHHAELTHQLSRGGLIIGVIAFAACGAAVASFFGLRSLMGTGGFQGWFVPLLSAAVIGGGLYGLWHKIIHIVPMLHDPSKRVLGTAIGGLLCLATIAISSWFIATSIGGDQAVRQHMISSMEAYDTQLRQAYDNALMESGLIPDVLRLSAELSALADEERRTGSLSGQSGAGQVVATLERAADGYLELANELEDAQENVNQLHQQGVALIGQMQAQINSPDGTSHVRQQRFGEAVVSLQGVLSEMAQASRLENVLRHGLVIVEYVVSSEGQRIALDHISSSMSEFTERLTTAAERVKEERQPIAAISFMPTNAGMATWNHAGEIPGAWAIGIGIDTLPLILLLILLLGHAEARNPYQQREPFSVVVGHREAS